jgi:hypothetical protein
MQKPGLQPIVDPKQCRWYVHLASRPGAGRARTNLPTAPPDGYPVLGEPRTTATGTTKAWWPDPAATWGK